MKSGNIYTVIDKGPSLYDNFVVFVNIFTSAELSFVKIETYVLFELNWGHFGNILPYYVVSFHSSAYPNDFILK